MRRAPLVVPALLVATALLAAACSGSSAGHPAVDTPSPSRSPDGSALASPTPSRAPRAAPGDVDGDGRADEVRVTSTTVTVVLSGGGQVSAPVVAADVPKPLVSGLADLDLDGRNEVWLETARGASTSFVQIYRYDGTRLSELTYEGDHIRFGIGGSVTHGDGFSCTDSGLLVVRSAESDDGTSYRVRTRTYRVAGSALVLLSETNVTATSMDDPRVRAAYQVDCGAVGESG